MAEITQEQIEQTEKLIEVLVEQARTGEKNIEATIAEWKAKTKLGKATAELEKGTKALTSGIKDSMVALESSTGNFGDLSGAVSGTVKAVTGLMTSMNEAIGGIPFVGRALEGLGDAAIGVATFGFGQVQKNFDSFQELSKAGLIGADGVTGMAERFLEAGIPLQTYTKILADSAEDLTYFGGSVRLGEKQFRGVMTSMAQGEDMRLRNLGFSLEEIGDTVIDFQKTHQRMGIMQTMTQDQLLESSVRYGEELDMIAKITGQTRKDAQKNREAMLADTRFRAFMAKQVGEEGRKRAQAMGDLVTGIKDIAPKFSEGLKDLFASGGVATTEAGRNLVQQGMGPVIKRINDEMLSGNMTMAQARRELFKAAMENKDRFRDLNALVGDFGVGIPFQEMAEMARAVGMTDEEIQKLGKAQKKQTEGADATTDSLVRTMSEMQKTTAIMNQMFIATPYATKALSLFSDKLHDIVAFIDKEFKDLSRERGAETVRPATAMTVKEMQANKDAAAKRQLEERKKQLAMVRANYEKAGVTGEDLERNMATIREAYGLPPETATATITGPKPTAQPQAIRRQDVQGTLPRNDQAARAQAFQTDQGTPGMPAGAAGQPATREDVKILVTEQQIGNEYLRKLLSGQDKQTKTIRGK